jgi:CubicO group peptidase (beta-lactamase class C family)
VLHHGELFFTHAEGLANIEEDIIPNDETIYPVASNTKAFITALCGILVDEGFLSWTDPVSKYLPDFETAYDPEVGKRATLLDLCSHGTGLAPLDCAGVGFFDEFLNPGSTGVKKASNLPTAYDLRTHWLYNNFLLDVVGTVISSKCQKRSGLVMRERIFQPLGMTRTFTRSEEYKEDKNYARGYSILDNGSALLNESPGLEDGEIQGASGYVRSTVRDMLTWAKAVMEAEENGQKGSQEPPAGLQSHTNPLRQMRMTRCAHRPIVLGEEGCENSYGLGWFRHMLPSRFLCSIGPNFSLLPNPPVINQNGPPRLAIAHWGEFGGCLSAFYTFPATRSAIIVMSNCNGAKGDPTDLIAQTLCQELFAMQPRIDFEEYALQAANNATIAWEALVEDWVRKRVQNTRHPPLDGYTGTYTNTALDITIKVSKIPENQIRSETNPEMLTFNINSLPRQTARLRHYHYDTWTFMPDSRNDATRKGMAGFLRLPRLLLVFVRNEIGVVSHLEWDLQGGSCEGPAPDLGINVAPVRFLKAKEEQRSIPPRCTAM